MRAKTRADNLAQFGGSPLFDLPLHVNKPMTAERHQFDRYLDRAWRDDRFSNGGALSVELEQRLAERLEVEFCLLLSNGTAAMATLLIALGLKGEVILPSFTFISTAHVLSLAGLKPVFCDISAKDGNISVEHCKDLITDNTAAIIPTHLWGRPCDMLALEELTKDSGVSVIADAAHAFGCSSDGRSVGTFGLAEVFSFHATKAFHTAEGGAVTTNDPALAAAIRKAQNFGFVDLDRVSGLGINAKMSELSVAMGLANLDAFDVSVDMNRRVHQAYVIGLSEVDAIEIVPYDTNEKNNYWYITAKLSPSASISRDQVISLLHGENILARRYFYPGCHRMEPYSQSHPEADQMLPNTNDMANQVIMLPGGGNVSADDVAKVCTLIAFILETGVEISNRLETSKSGKDNL